MILICEFGLPVIYVSFDDENPSFAASLKMGWVHFEKLFASYNWSQQWVPLFLIDLFLIHIGWAGLNNILKYVIINGDVVLVGSLWLASCSSYVSLWQCFFHYYFAHNCWIVKCLMYCLLFFCIIYHIVLCIVSFFI